MYSTYESTVKEMIGIDGILYDYVEQVEPADPPEGAGLVAIERWKTARKKYEAASELLIKDCATTGSNVRGVADAGERNARGKESDGGVRSPRSVDMCGSNTHEQQKIWRNIQHYHSS